MKIQKIAMITTALSVVAIAGIQDAENLLNFTIEKSSFKCTKTECVGKNYVTESKDKKINVGEIKLQFKENAKLNFTFNKDKAEEKVKETCKGKSIKEIESLAGKTSEMETCLKEEKIKVSTDAIAYFTKQIEKVVVNNVSVETNGTTVTAIDTLSGSVGKGLIALSEKPLDKITVNDLQFRSEMDIISTPTPTTVIEDTREALGMWLPRAERTEVNTVKGINVSTVIELKTIQKLNQSFIDMYSLIAEEVSKQKEIGKQETKIVLETKLEKDNSLTVNLEAKSDSRVFGTMSSNISFSIINVSGILSTLKSTDILKENGGMVLMTLLQSIGFKSLSSDIDVTPLKEVNDKLTKSEKKYKEIRETISKIKESKEFKEESKKLTNIDLFNYKILELAGTKATMSIVNKNNTPLMMLVMMIGKRDMEAIGKMLDIKTNIEK